MKLEDNIKALLRKISLATSILSFHIYDQPQLLEIIAIGDDAVPILLDHLREFKVARATDYKNHDFYDFSPWYALIALGQITGANPTKPENAGRLVEIVDGWLAWKPGDDNHTGSLTYWPDVHLDD